MFTTIPKLFSPYLSGYNMTSCGGPWPWSTTFLDASTVKDETVVGHGVMLTRNLLEISSHAIQEERKNWVWVE